MAESWKETKKTSSGSATVEFVSLDAETVKTIRGLSKTALRESGKVVRKVLRKSIGKHTGNLKNHIASWAFIGKNDGIPQLQVGFYGWQKVRKRGKKPSRASPWWQEFGTNAHAITTGKKILGNNGHFYAKTVQHPGNKDLHILRNAVYDNIDEIQRAQKAALAEISKELKQAQAKIDGSEEVEDDD